MRKTSFKRITLTVFILIWISIKSFGQSKFNFGGGIILSNFKNKTIVYEKDTTHPNGSHKPSYQIEPIRMPGFYLFSTYDWLSKNRWQINTGIKFRKIVEKYKRSQGILVFGFSPNIDYFINYNQYLSICSQINFKLLHNVFIQSSLEFILINKSKQKNFYVDGSTDSQEGLPNKKQVILPSLGIEYLIKKDNTRFTLSVYNYKIDNYLIEFGAKINISKKVKS